MKRSSRKWFATHWQASIGVVIKSKDIRDAIKRVIKEGKTHGLLAGISKEKMSVINEYIDYVEEQLKKRRNPKSLEREIRLADKFIPKKEWKDWINLKQERVENFNEFQKSFNELDFESSFKFIGCNKDELKKAWGRQDTTWFNGEFRLWMWFRQYGEWKFMIFTSPMKGTGITVFNPVEGKEKDICKQAMIIVKEIISLHDGIK